MSREPYGGSAVAVRLGRILVGGDRSCGARHGDRLDLAVVVDGRQLLDGRRGLQQHLGVRAAAVVGGTAINGGRGSVIGTLIGVTLLGTIGTALTFLGINPFWEKAIQGAIILAAIVSDVVFARARQRQEAQVA